MFAYWTYNNRYICTEIPSRATARDKGGVASVKGNCWCTTVSFLGKCTMTIVNIYILRLNGQCFLQPMFWLILHASFIFHLGMWNKNIILYIIFYSFLFYSILFCCYVILYCMNFRAIVLSKSFNSHLWMQFGKLVFCYHMNSRVVFSILIINQLLKQLLTLELSLVELLRVLWCWLFSSLAASFITREEREESVQHHLWGTQFHYTLA